MTTTEDRAALGRIVDAVLLYESKRAAGSPEPWTAVGDVYVADTDNVAAMGAAITASMTRAFASAAADGPDAVLNAATGMAAMCAATYVVQEVKAAVGLVLALAQRLAAVEGVEVGPVLRRSLSDLREAGG